MLDAPVLDEIECGAFLAETIEFESSRRLEASATKSDELHLGAVIQHKPEIRIRNR